MQGKEGYGREGEPHRSDLPTSSLMCVPWPVFNFRRQYWLWCPIMAPILGALCMLSLFVFCFNVLLIYLTAGTFIYDFLFYRGADSVLNKR